MDSRDLSETRGPDAVAVTDARWEKIPPGHEGWGSWRLQEQNSQHRKKIDASCPPTSSFLLPSLPSNVKTFNIYLLYVCVRAHMCVHVHTHTHMPLCSHEGHMHFPLPRVTQTIRQQTSSPPSCDPLLIFFPFSFSFPLPFSPPPFFHI